MYIILKAKGETNNEINPAIKWSFWENYYPGKAISINYLQFLLRILEYHFIKQSY